MKKDSNIEADTEANKKPNGKQSTPAPVKTPEVAGTPVPTGVSPKTGDVASVAWLMIFVVSAGVITLCVAKKNREEI